MAEMAAFRRHRFLVVKFSAKRGRLRILHAVSPLDRHSGRIRGRRDQDDLIETLEVIQVALVPIPGVTTSQ